METISHRAVAVNGINMHVAEKGEGPVVLLLHGFPELWYTWRHQILSLASRGYRAVAPDLRGFGDTDAPADIRSYSILHIVGDLVALIDSLAQDKVFVVGHDWGATVAWTLCMLRPDRVKALVNMSVVFSPRHAASKPVDSIRAMYGDDHYICMFQEPGAAEAGFAQMDTKLLVKSYLTYREPEAHMGSKVPEFGVDRELPPWLTEEDVHYIASKFDKSGFTGGLNYYRNMNWLICDSRDEPLHLLLFGLESNLVIQIWVKKNDVGSNNEFATGSHLQCFHSVPLACESAFPRSVSYPLYISCHLWFSLIQDLEWDLMGIVVSSAGEI